jgi:phosphatidylinositol alpha-1,6-mannosyltransferase
LRVLLYTHEFPPFKGGAGRYVAQIAAALQLRGVSPHVLAPRYQGFEPEAMGVDESSVSRFTNVSAIRNAWRLLWAVIRHDIDHIIIAESGAIADFLVIPLPNFVGYSVVAHGTEILNYLHPSRARLDAAQRHRMKRFFEGADAVIQSSNAGIRLLRECRIEHERSILVYPTVDPATLPKSSPEVGDALKDRYGLGNERVVLSIARLDIDKGQDVLLKAFARVLKSHPDVKLIIGGEGPRRKALEEMARSLKIAGAVCFAGLIPASEIVAHHELSSFFVMPSRSAKRFEGFGIVYLEAALCQRTSVAGNHGGVSEAVEDGVTGVLVDPADQDSVAAAMIRLFDDSGYCERLSEKAYDRATTEFSLLRMAERLDGWLDASAPIERTRQWRSLRLAFWTIRLAFVSIWRLPRAGVRFLMNRGTSRPVDVPATTSE